MNDISGVYTITNTYNGNQYVGSSVNIQKRLKKHKWMLDRNLHHSHHLQSAWNKYGMECFEFSVIETCSSNLLIQREQYYIDALSPIYNESPTARSPQGVKRSDESRAKMSASHMGLPSPKGMKDKKHSLETLSKMSISQTGKTNTPESIVRMQEAQKNRSPETRAKLSASKMGHSVSLEARIKMSISQLARWSKRNKQDVE